MSTTRTVALSVLASGLLALATPLNAQSVEQDPGNGQPTEPVMIVNGEVFPTWASYTGSEVFQSDGLRCQKPSRDFGSFIPPLAAATAGDCGYFSTNPTSEYAPSFVYNIPVVVHVIQRTSGTGFISASKVQSQIDILNEDFRAMAGTPGAPGTDAMIQFHLATEDPSGNPTNGITYSSNNTWYNDGGSYWNSLAWDTNRYMNVYTNSASGALGYVPDLPQGGIVGQASDRVVVLWSAFGDNAPIGPPFDKGRTLTHEVGHYLGLEHTFSGGCGSASACYSTGDLICDTPREQNPTSGCPGNKTSCSSSDPIHNYMDYSDDTCMWEFSPEQVRRMRCTLQFFRSDLDDPVVGTWDDLGGGTVGSNGTPTISGTGDLTSGSPVTVALTNAPGGAAMLAWIAFSSVPVSALGGTLYATPYTTQLIFLANGAGAFQANTNWPVGLPPATEVWFQFLVQDPSVTDGLTLSNGLKATTP